MRLHTCGTVSLVRVLLVLSVCLLMSGCDRYHIRKDLERIMGSTIVLPSDVSMAFEGEVVSMPDSLRSGSKMIVYIDSSGCSMCRISKLGVYESLYSISRATQQFNLILMVAGGEIEGIPLSRIIADSEFNIPVYVDEKRRFLKDNPVIPSDARMHSFFIDKDGKTIFVGDPVYNGKIMNLLKTYLNQQYLLEPGY